MIGLMFPPKWKDDTYRLSLYKGPILQKFYELNRTDPFTLGKSKECRQLLGNNNGLLVAGFHLVIRFNELKSRFCMVNSSSSESVLLLNGKHKVNNQIPQGILIELYPGDQIFMKSGTLSFRFHRRPYPLLPFPNPDRQFLFSTFPIKVDYISDDFIKGTMQFSSEEEDLPFEPVFIQRFFSRREAISQYNILMDRKTEFTLHPNRFARDDGMWFIFFKGRYQHIHSWLMEKNKSWECSRKLISNIHEAIFSMHCHGNHGNLYEGLLIDDDSKIFICNFRDRDIGKVSGQLKDAHDLLKVIAITFETLGCRWSGDLDTSMNCSLPEDVKSYISMFKRMFDETNKEFYIWILHHPIGWEEEDEVRFIYNLHELLHSLGIKDRNLLRSELGLLFPSWWIEKSAGDKIPLTSACRTSFNEIKYHSSESLVIFCRNVLEHFKQNHQMMKNSHKMMENSLEGTDDDLKGTYDDLKGTYDDLKGTYDGLKELKSFFPDLINLLFNALAQAFIDKRMKTKFDIKDILRKYIID